MKFENINKVLQFKHAQLRKYPVEKDGDVEKKEPIADVEEVEQRWAGVGGGIFDVLGRTKELLGGGGGGEDDYALLYWSSFSCEVKELMFVEDDYFYFPDWQEQENGDIPLN